MEILKDLDELGLLGVIPLFALSDYQSIENRVEKLCIEVDKQFVDSALDDDFTCVLWMRFFLALNEDLYVGPWVFLIGVLEVIMGVGENKVVLFSFFVD